MEFVSLGVAVVSLVQFFGYNIFHLRPEAFARPYSTIGHPVFSAGVMTMLLPISLFNITEKKNLIIRIIFPVVIITGIITTLTRSSYIAVTVQLILAVIFLSLIYKREKSKKKLARYAVVSLIAVLVFVVIFSIFSPQNIFIKRVKSIATLTEQPRWFLWKDSFRMFKDYPLTGVGIGNFSVVFENYSSYDLKLSDVRGIFDNAHNNFINTLCTTGIFGALSYAAILLFVVIYSGKTILNESQGRKNRFFSLFILCSFAGYIIYGLGDFDDITMSFFLFIFLVIFKVHYVNSGGSKRSMKPPGKAVAIAVLIFVVFNIYFSFNKIRAEYLYSQGIQNYYAGNFNGFLNNLNKALQVEPEESVYRYDLANYLFDYGAKQQNLSGETKKKLFAQAKDEAVNAEKNFFSKLSCKVLQALIELESGNIQEGFRIKEEIFKTDTCQFGFRNNLARYYLKNNYDSLALKEINIVMHWDPSSIEAISTYVIYLERTKNYEEAASYCRKILDINSTNQFAKNTLSRLNALIKK